MGRKKKPFIDKKNATVFRLVHRSQKDPLIADESAAQRVFTEVQGGNQAKQPVSKTAQLETQREHGIFFDDDYDYMQHLRERGQGDFVWEASNPTREGKVELPACVLPSAREEPIGMLAHGAPRGLDPSLDPDIMAALDDDFDWEDPDLQLEDDFINMAEGVESGEEIEDDEEEEEEEEEAEGEMGSDKDLDSDFYDDECPSLPDLEERSRFTEYSVSSSVLPRNENLALLDDKFEEMFREYEEVGVPEEELRAVDEEEPVETPSRILEQLCEEFEEHGLPENEEEVDKRRVLALAARQEERAERREMVVEDTEERAILPWDCETILSTYSNLYNHPKVIQVPRPIRLDKRGMVLEEEEGEEGSGEENEEEEEEDEENTIQISNLRSKSETAEERRARKKAVKEGQRLRRQIKKATKEVYKEEKTREAQSSRGAGGRTIKL